MEVFRPAADIAQEPGRDRGAGSWLAQECAGLQDKAMGEIVVDAQFLKCPMPVLRAARELRALGLGERLRVLTTDAASVADFQAFCRETGHALVAWSETKGVFSFTIRKGEKPPRERRTP
jgi:tRNA 2-thiouridine synthesizing protein A